jgi:hypothetical protein
MGGRGIPAYHWFEFGMKIMSESKDSAPAPKPEAKIDEIAVRLANASEQALVASAKAEGDILSSQRLDVYAKAGIAHLESIRCGKASIDHECEVRGVASSWNPSCYEATIDSITKRVRAAHPELFTNFDALAEKPVKSSHANERIHTRILVGLVAQSLAALIGEKVWSLPYRLVANYLVADRVFKFSKQDVVGELRIENVEFLRTQLGMVADGKATAASFLAALKAHFSAIDQAVLDEANSKLTPAERESKAKTQEAVASASEKQDKIAKVRKTLSVYLAKACNGAMSPDEIATAVKEAAKTAKVNLPIGKMDPRTITPAELSSFLDQVALKGGSSKEERKALKQIIMKHGSALAEQAIAKHKLSAAVNGHAKPAMAMAN